MSGNPGETLPRLDQVDRGIFLRSKQFSLALTARAYERPVTAHTPALLLQSFFVDISVFHDQLEVVLVIQHHIDIIQRITQRDARGSIYSNANSFFPLDNH